MKLIVGLGNPGKRYHDTRHNVGFLVGEALARRYHDEPSWHREDAGQSVRCRIARTPFRVLLPQTMMNDSGRALGMAARRWRVAPEELLIVCDDVNLPLGRLRLRPQGSDGGHHGLASCIDALGTDALPRLRLGVGMTPLPKDLTDFVLSPFAPAQRPQLEQALAHAVDACAWWVKEDIQTVMNRVNTRTAS